MVTKKSKNIRIDKISIKNYKGIDSLELTFPKPVMDGDPDILVMGSENGVGKTSVIECCSLLLLALKQNKTQGNLNFDSAVVDIPNLIISAGAQQCNITGTVAVANKKIEIEIAINRNNHVIPFTASSLVSILTRGSFESIYISDIISGTNLNPTLSSKFLIFHSYRKVLEGNIDTEMMVTSKYSNHAIFKVEMLRSFMTQSEHYEIEESKKTENSIITKKMDGLLQTYARCKIGTFRMSSMGGRAKVHLNVEDIKTGKPFNIDGLSSGQMEIISTIFLIWYSTLDNPCVVFIDEPELHLNAEWHRKLIRDITEMAPNNQYIIATHSKYIMGAVDSGKRFLLERNDKGS